MKQGYKCTDPEEDGSCDEGFAVLDTTIWWDDAAQKWELADDFLMGIIYCSECGGFMEDVVV